MKAKSKEETTDKELSFEQALKRLEVIAAAMEQEDISLDASLSHYEEGMRLMKLCHNKLEEAKKKVDVLVKKGPQEFSLEPLENE